MDDLVNKCRFFFKEFCADDIEAFGKSYKESKDEEEDLVNYFSQNNGNITKILEWIPLSHNSDIERFIAIFDRLIEDKVIESTQEYMDTRNHVQLIVNEDLEVEEHNNQKKRQKKASKKAKKGNKSNATFEQLQSQILAKKEKSSSDFLSNLAGKYCEEDDDPMGEMPSEEEFKKIQQTLKRKSKPKATGKAKAKGRTRKVSRKT